MDSLIRQCGLLCLIMSLTYSLTLQTSLCVPKLFFFELSILSSTQNPSFLLFAFFDF